MAKFTCPFCISTYSSGEVKYVCPDCGSASSATLPEKVAGRVTCKTPNCGRVASVRVCPKCENPIPPAVLETPNLPFSIVGVANSGKTNYITVMLNELGRTASLQLALGAQNAETRMLHEENRKLIYEKRIPPESTAAGTNTPQIWSIKNLAKQRGHNVPTYTFTIFDGAGEDHENNLDASSVEFRYISSSKAILLVLDPLILYSVQNGGIVPPEVLRNSLGGHEGEAKSAETVVNNIVHYIKAMSGVRARDKLKIPVAVTMTKFDTLYGYPEFSQHSMLRKSSLSVNGGSVNMGELDGVHAEIDHWLRTIGENGFLNTMDANFSQYRFFGVSSYGKPPLDANTLSSVAPHRVLDPILWLFKLSKFVD